MTAAPLASIHPERSTDDASGIREHAADKLARLAGSYDGVAFLEAIKSGELPVPPIAELIGFDIRDIGNGKVSFTFEPRLAHYNPIGTVHGGVAATLLDTVMGCAVQTVLPAGTGYTTLDVSVRYLRPITVDIGTLVATGRVVHRGRRTATAEAELVDATLGRVFATGTSTLLVVQP